MNTDHYITHGEYIILRKQGHGEFKPLTFSDGTLVIYGSHAEAKDDAGHDGVVAEIIIPKN